MYLHLLSKCFLLRNEVESSHTSDCQRPWKTCRLLLGGDFFPCFTHRRSEAPERERIPLRWNSNAEAVMWSLRGQIPERGSSSYEAPATGVQLLRSLVGALWWGAVHSFLSLQCGNYLGPRERILEEQQLGSLGPFPNSSMATVYLLGSLAMAKIPTRGVENSVWPQSPAAVSFISSAELLEGQYIIPGYGIQRHKYPATLGPPSTLRVGLVWEPDSCGPISLLMLAARTDVLMYKAYIGWWFHHQFKFSPWKFWFFIASQMHTFKFKHRVRSFLVPVYVCDVSIFLEVLRKLGVHIWCSSGEPLFLLEEGGVGAKEAHNRSFESALIPPSNPAASLWSKCSPWFSGKTNSNICRFLQTLDLSSRLSFWKQVRSPELHGEHYSFSEEHLQIPYSKQPAHM